GEETLKRLEAAIRRELENNKRINFLISPVAMDVKEIRTEMQNLVEIQKQNAVMILSVLRVPPIVLGFGDSGNYVNRKEQLKAFYENAVFPIANAIEQAFRKHNMEIRFKRENVEVLQESLSDKVNTLNALILAGYPLSQAAEMLGLPKPYRVEKPEEKKMVNIMEKYIPMDIYHRGVNIKQKFYAKQVKLSERVRQKILNIITTNRNIFLDSYYHDVIQAVKDNNLPLLDVLLDNFLSFINPKMEIAAKDLFLEILEDYSEVAKIQLQGDILRYTMVDVVSVRHAKKITRVNETVKNQIREVVVNGLQEGKPTIEIGEDIKKVFQAQRNRLNTIARTETTSILNDFVLEEAKMRDFTHKIWLTAHDEAVRHTHQAQDYLRIGIEEVFPNGLSYPGDINGKPEEVINCRCTLLFE
ncbi:MAG: phage portal protein, partial [Brevinematia bacterium]